MTELSLPVRTYSYDEAPKGGPVIDTGGDNAARRAAALRELQAMVDEGIDVVDLSRATELSRRIGRLRGRLLGWPPEAVVRALLEEIVDQARPVKRNSDNYLLAAGEFIGIRDESMVDPAVPSYEKPTPLEHRLRRGGRLLPKPVTNARNARKHIPDALTVLLDKVGVVVAKEELAARLEHRLTRTTTPHDEDDDTIRPAMTRMAPGPSPAPRLRHARQGTTRRIGAVTATVLIAGASIVALVRSLADDSAARSNDFIAPNCSDVGNRESNKQDPRWGPLFTEAYQRGGGQDELGCPRSDDTSGYVHTWARGTSQDLQGGRAGRARIMTLDRPGSLFVMSGAYHEDYTYPYGNDAAQHMGYPITKLTRCESFDIVLLDEAEPIGGIRPQAPGAMITNPATGRLVWVPRDIWERYLALSGPLGRLGLPIDMARQASGGLVQRFVHGHIRSADGLATTDLEDTGKAEPAPYGDLTTCIGPRERGSSPSVSTPATR